ncbi:energy transducer TonB [Pedobacter xixiisoli]|uniref:TonB family C-terminal domain-containing protein n=1 Tax=Pedobacter xixiisoli TaxID=1476464 RepID=A0A286AD45_9SPHI|nr:energy transducer TonB [Pedobacter xixiisoli]SOD19823.1 TonB family C-terminal domain-containing protein [Pedobacter xixiisoli]
MKKLTLILFLAVTKIGFCQNAQQDTTLVYNSPIYTKDPVRSKWRPVVQQVGEFYQVTFYNAKDVIQEVISFADKDLTIRKGPYLLYLAGKLTDKGFYEQGNKHGEWIQYNNDGTAPLKIETFRYDKLNGPYNEYWAKGDLFASGNYINNKKSGVWKYYYSEGEFAGEETFDENEKKITHQYYDREGNIADFDNIFTAPNYKGGINKFYRFLANQMRYPKQSAKQKIQGIVVLKFDVKKDGSVEDIEVVETPNEEMATEAVRVLKLSKEWTPGKIFGEPVTVKYHIPIRFAL